MAHLLGFKKRPPHSQEGKQVQSVSPDAFTHSFDSCHMVVAEDLIITSEIEQKWA